MSYEHTLLIEELIAKGVVSNDEVLYHQNIVNEKIETSFPTIDFFRPSMVTRRFGHSFEEYIEDLFDDVKPKLKKIISHDRTILFESGKVERLEIKGVRLLSKVDVDHQSLEERALPLDSEDNKKKATLLQVKPSCSEYVLGGIIGCDDIELFLLPCCHISQEAGVLEENRIRLSTQHLYNEKEGQIDYLHFKEYSIGTVSQILKENDGKPKIESYIKKIIDKKS